jgi:hypothetical protein
MDRTVIALGLVVALGLSSRALAQERPDFSGTWKFNQGKSTPGIAGNTPIVPFPSQIVVKQTASEIAVESTSVRQAPLKAVFKLDGSKVTVEAPRGITETGEARFEGATLIVTTRRSFSSPAGETIVDFRETWRLDGSVLTIEKTRTESGESATQTAVYDKV